MIKLRPWPFLLLCAGLTTPAASAQDQAKEAVPAGPAPAINCDQPEYDFKTAAQGEEVKHVFTVKNKGKGLLKIERAQGG